MKPNFSDQYFESLLVATSQFETLYITDDGNIYRSQEQAEQRANDAIKVHGEIVRWAKIEKGEEPLTNEELEKVFMAQYFDHAAVKEVVEDKSIGISTDAAQSILKERRAQSVVGEVAKSKTK